MNKLSSFFKKHFPVFTFWCGKKKCLASTYLYRSNPVKWTLKKYRKRFKKDLNLKNPQTFFEKTNYLKHYYFNEEETLLSDKYRVKDLLIQQGEGKHIAKVLFQTSNIKELKSWVKENKEKYNKFVIKNNHSCGDIFIYKNGTITRKYGLKIKNINKVFKMLNIGLKYNHYYTCFEPNYRYIKPLVFVEEFLDIEDSIEYEFMVNYGQVKFINVVTKRQSEEKSEILVDHNWVPLSNKCSSNIVKPSNLTGMLDFIKKFSSNLPFCRVDFIETKSNYYFCEFTFIKSGGIGKFEFDSMDEQLGGLIDISPIIIGGDKND